MSNTIESYIIDHALGQPDNGHDQDWNATTLSGAERRQLEEWDDLHPTNPVELVTQLLGAARTALLIVHIKETIATVKAGYQCECGCGCTNRVSGNATYCHACGQGRCGE